LNQIAAITEHRYGVGWEVAQESSAQSGPRSSGFAHDEGACGADTYDVEIAQLLCKDARTERPVSTDVHATKENDNGHALRLGSE
jgi:hypothetical protein